MHTHAPHESEYPPSDVVHEVRIGLLHSEFQRRIRALAMLEELGMVESHAAYVIDLLDDPRSKVRVNARKALDALPDPRVLSNEHAHALFQILSSPYPKSRKFVMKRVLTMESDVLSAHVMYLISMLLSADVSYDALNALNRVNVATLELYINHIVVACLTSPEEVHLQADTYVFQKLDKDALAMHADFVVKKMRFAMETNYPTRVIFCIRYLKTLHPADLYKHTSDIVAVAKGRNIVSGIAIKTLGNLEPRHFASVEPFVVESLNSEDDAVRASAVEVLHSSLSSADMLPHMLTISRMLMDSSNDVVSAAKRALQPLARGRVDFSSAPSEVYAQLVRKLGWYRCRANFLAKGVSLFWLSQLFVPGGPGQERDLRDFETWREHTFVR